MKEYNWNENNVCINPDTIHVSTKTCNVYIETAERGGEWYYGFSYNNDNFYDFYNSPCASTDNPCSTQNLAVVRAILHIRRWAQPRGVILKKLMSIYFDKAQLTLF